MSCHVREQMLFRSPAVSLRDYRCRPRETAPAPEEAASRNEIVFLRSGMFRKHVGREAVIADLNCVLFFRRGEAYRVSHPVTCGDDCSVLSVRDDLLAEMAARHEPAVGERPGRPISFSHAPCAPSAYLAHRRLFEHVSNGNGDALAVEEAALRLAAGVLADAYAARGARPARRREDTAGAHRDLAESVRALLAVRFRDAMSIDAVARSVHSSPFHLSRVFREQAGMPMHRYRNRLRLRASIEPLAAGAEDLTALALDLGFAGHSHFTEAFRREFGTSPSAFRHAVRNGHAGKTSKILKAARNAVA